MKNREVCKVGRRLFLSRDQTNYNEDDLQVKKAWLQSRNTGWLDIVASGKSMLCAVTHDKWMADEDLRSGAEL